MTPESTTRRRPHFYYGWVIVVVVGLMGFTRTTETYPVLAVFLKPMTEEFNWSRTAFTGAMVIGTLLGGFIAVGIGPLIDRYGPRWALIIAFSVVGGSLILMASITTLWQFYALQIISRMFHQGVISLAMTVIIPKWFIAKRGRAAALAELGSRVGNSVIPLYTQVIVSVWSWRIATATAGMVMLVVSLLPVAMFLRRSPEDMGLLPDGATREEMETSGADGPSTPKPGTPGLEVSMTLREVLRQPSFYLLVAAFGMIGIVTTGLSLHTIPYFTDRGLSPEIAVVLVAVWWISGAPASIVYGFIVEKYNIRIVMTVAYILAAIGFVILLAVHSLPMGLLWGIYYGLMSGGMGILEQVVFANYYGREHLGAIRGATMPVRVVAHALGPLVGALAYDITGTYVLIFMMFGVFTLCSGLFVFLARPPSALVTVDIGESPIGSSYT